MKWNRTANYEKLYFVYGKCEYYFVKRLSEYVYVYSNQYCSIHSVFLCGEHPDRKAWQATVHRVTESWTRPKGPRMHRHRLFFACDSSAPVKVVHEGGSAAWVAGTMVAPSVQGYGLPQPLVYWAHQSPFSSLWYLTIRRPLRLVFVRTSARSGT